jgi:hypothetical protein
VLDQMAFFVIPAGSVLAGVLSVPINFPADESDRDLK